MSRLALAALTLAASLLLAGCGQKGPLYLPDDEAAAERYGTGAAAPNDDES
ncbi:MULTISPECIES: LPS translocon maturation chaperone LptM [Halomonadaceae]|jgi:predicted small lipoprotein YifL|uniref:Lipoprotein n=1 Tax=Billgrantia aerodenitrificans TaxID=2733483 RepID=A0ABS9AVY0_9GAMM|nr:MULTISPECIES: lipoprotein [Halomonas]MCE8026037.1 lipoprotein [Halomonas aerodenitrificans]MCE8036488.1 lipoprotein [Halomonas sp. MCCC 1A11062]